MDDCGPASRYASGEGRNTGADHPRLIDMFESRIDDGAGSQELSRDKIDGISGRNAVAFLVHAGHKQVPRQRRREVLHLGEAFEAVDKTVIVAIGDLVIPIRTASMQVQSIWA